MFPDFDVTASVKNVFSRHADKTDIVAYHQLAALTIENTEPDVLMQAFNSGISPERQGMVLAMLAARACVVASRNPDTKIVFDTFNKLVFNRILKHEDGMNAVQVPQEKPSEPDITVFMPDDDNQSMDVRALGDVLKKISARIIDDEPEATFAWFDHHVYASALKSLGAAVPADVVDIASDYKTDARYKLDLAGLMKDDLIALMIEDSAAYLHRCHLYVRHQTPNIRGPHGHGPMPGGFMRITVI